MPREKAPCGNPLFLQWVEELRDQAREKGTKAAESYGKAARSLAACPVPYPRPRDLVVLQGIGPKIVGILEGKWKKHCEENGLPAPGTPSKEAKGKGRAPPSPASDSELAALSGDEPPVPKKKKTSKPKAPKTYIPQKGSGGYGILIGLVLAIDRPEINTQVFLTKGELIRAAQPYCDSSYDHSEKGTYFTAWSSMKSLVTKGYVYVTGNPHKYCLTEDGYDVACAIRALIPDLSHIPKHPFLHDSMDTMAVPTVEKLRKGKSTSITVLPLSPPISASGSVPPLPKPRGNKFEFWYINSIGHRTASLSDAASRLDPVEFVMIRKIEFRADQRDHPFCMHLKQIDGQPQRRLNGFDTFFAHIMEDGAPPECSKFNESDLSAVLLDGQAQDSAQDQAQRARKPNERKFMGLDDNDWIAPAPSVCGHLSAEASSLLQCVAVDDDDSIDLTETITSGASVKQLIKQPSRTISRTKTHNGPRLSSHVPLRNPLLDAADPSPPTNPTDFDPAQASVFRAGTFDIVLILDTREVESKTNRDRIAEKLAEKGVVVETRALKLGDMCWIARRRDGMGGEDDECVLDYVVERKRLDDLCHSIRDGRYTEQCFRLTNSCINHVFYVVEDWQTSHHMEFSGLQIMTAKSQIQVHNRFFLQETHKLSETIDFLITMTKTLTQTLSKTDLRIIPTRFLSRSSYGVLHDYLKYIQPDKTYLTSFQAYQDLNDKNASKTLKERFARMLMCVKGMSTEKVSAVLDEFDTPRALWDALKEVQGKEKEYQERLKTQGGDVDDSETGQTGSGAKGKKAKARRGPEMFFADRIQGEGRRKIGDALSKDLFRVFMGSSYSE